VSDRLIAPGESFASVTDRVTGIVFDPPHRLGWWLLMLLALALVGLGTLAIGWLFVAGIGIWGINIPVAWGFAISNYVWWIGMASGGTMISSLFHVMRADWRSSVNRLAETMTLFAAACAGIFPILHLGRPYYFYWLFPYPNVMGLWPQFRSPLLWDFFAILTYVLCSILFWYVGLIPDLATMRDRAPSRAGQIVYGPLELGWRGSALQWLRYQSAYRVLAGLMGPLVISVHSIVGLDFAGGLTPGWHSTQYPPFFVFGAVLSGFGIVLMLAIPLRRAYRLEALITPRHLDILARLTLLSSLAVGYAYAMDLFTAFYGDSRYDHDLALDRLIGHYAPLFWITILCNLLLPQALWWRRVRQDTRLLLVVGASVVLGMWCERILIVLQSLAHEYEPSRWGLFHPTFWDWATLLGTIGLFLAGLLLLLRLLPALSLFELRDLLARRGAAHG
jgi:Ni/Fe-hydrogenase subunit HybB-like protein